MALGMTYLIIKRSETASLAILVSVEVEGDSSDSRQSVCRPRKQNAGAKHAQSSPGKACSRSADTDWNMIDGEDLLVCNCHPHFLPLLNELFSPKVR